MALTLRCLTRLVITVAGNVQGNNWNRCPLELLHLLSDSLGDKLAASLDANQD